MSGWHWGRRWREKEKSKKGRNQRGGRVHSSPAAAPGPGIPKASFIKHSPDSFGGPIPSWWWETIDGRQSGRSFRRLTNHVGSAQRPITRLALSYETIRVRFRLCYAAESWSNYADELRRAPQHQLPPDWCLVCYGDRGLGTSPAGPGDAVCITIDFHPLDRERIKTRLKQLLKPLNPRSNHWTRRKISSLCIGILVNFME